MDDMTPSNFDINKEFVIFTDFVSPYLNVYEQVIYIYLLRHSHLLGSNNVTISVRSSRYEMGFGAGDGTKPMSESTLTKKLFSLEEKGLLAKQGSDRNGTRLQIILPSRTSYANQPKANNQPISIMDIDYFENPIGRKAILTRENNSCFYCMIALDSENHVIEHIVSRPEGKNTYTNLVAACRSCNNKKSNIPASTHLRNLYRNRILSKDELFERLFALDKVQAGELIPDINLEKM